MTSLREIMRRAFQAQQEHERRIDVQLAIPEIQDTRGIEWATEDERRENFEQGLEQQWEDWWQEISERTV